MLNEANIINMLQKHSHGFIGDDAAIINVDSNVQYLITKDLLVEDVHFRMNYYTPADLAHKALHVNLSDLSAMGATPQFILCGIAIPMSHTHYAESLLSHLVNACNDVGVILIGGDTTKSPEKLYISITAIGTAPLAAIKQRNGAEASDLICIAGDIGHAHIGLTALENGIAEYSNYKRKCLRPNAKMLEGVWLGAQSCVTSMMDISDGLFIDLKRLSAASKVSSIIEVERLEIDALFLDACRALLLDPINTMLAGGEDYALLFTVKKDALPALQRDFHSAFGYQLKHIGYIDLGSSVYITKDNKIIELDIKSFTHFGEKI